MEEIYNCKIKFTKADLVKIYLLEVKISKNIKHYLKPIFFNNLKIINIHLLF